MYGHDKNYYHFCKSDISVVDLSEDLKNLVKVLKHMSFVFTIHRQYFNVFLLILNGAEFLTVQFINRK